MDTHEALTYPRLNLKDNTLDENLPPARLFGHAFDVNEPEVDLGSLNLLPLELLYSVMASLDLCSISTLRMVNRQSLMTVDSFPPFKCIIKHAHPALHGALMIHSAKWITCEKLFKIICTSECESCGDFAGYVYLITCKRVCFLCLSQDDKYLPYTFTGRKSRAFSRILDILPHMRSISGIYSPNEKQESRQLCLWDRESVQQCGDLEVMKRMAESQARLSTVNLATSYGSWLLSRHRSWIIRLGRRRAEFIVLVAETQLANDLNTSDEDTRQKPSFYI